MNKATAWFLACRPKTLSVSLSPVLVGTALAWHDTHRVLWLPLLAAALGAAFIQIGTNLFNDVGDFLRGTDTPDRLGPRRAAAEGWLSVRAIRSGAWLAFALAFACGIYLVWHGGWPIVAIGLASLAAGWAYTGGPKPIAYGPLGEVFVFVFFGLVATLGTLVTQAHRISLPGVLGAYGVGALATAILVANNLRDIPTDTISGKRTLAVRLGDRRTRLLYAVLVASAFLAALGIALSTPWAAVTLLASPLGVLEIRRVLRGATGRDLIPVLAGTGKLQLAYAALLALALTR